MIRAIKGNNFSGKSFYLKCFTNYPSPVVQKVNTLTKVLNRDIRRSLYIHPIPEYSFTGVFDTLRDELLRFSNPKEISPLIQEFITSFGIDDLFDQNPFSLSGGEKSMTAVLAFAIMNPKALAIDTTLEQLDNKRRERLLKCLDVLDIPEIIYTDNRLDEIDNSLFQLIPFNPLKESEKEMLPIESIRSELFNPTSNQEGCTLEVHDINFSYGRKRILHNLSFTLEPGNIYHLKGENGSGKSTLSKLLTGVLKPKKSSHLKINGKETKLYKSPGKFVGYSFQQPDEQFFATSIANELQLEKNNKEYRASVLQTFGLSNLVNLHPFDLPISLRKRLAIATTLVEEKAIYILDEPTLYLDNNSVEDLSKIINQITNNGKTVVLVSHSESFISRFDRIKIIQLNKL